MIMKLAKNKIKVPFRIRLIRIHIVKNFNCDDESFKRI